MTGIDESANIAGTQYGITGNQHRGRRTIVGARPPSPKTHGRIGDVCRLPRVPASLTNGSVSKAIQGGNGTTTSGTFLTSLFRKAERVICDRE